MKTPIQELIEHFTDAWSSPSDLWKPSKVIEKIESMLEKEKEVIINAWIKGHDSDCLQEQDERLFAEEYYNETFNTKEK